jgi:2-oxoglutarate dehydrogenase E2 component (dihydrolipoamide succinyltransferase)
MLIEVKVPQLSESVAEATLVRWHKKVGESVARDENLIDIETDKVVLETPAPDAGVLVAIIKQDGALVASGELIAQIDTEGKAATAVPAAAAQAAAPAAAPAVVSAASTSTAASPAARKIMDERGLAGGDVQGTGRGGRITKPDAVGAQPPLPPAAARPAAAPAAAVASLPQPPVPVKLEELLADRPAAARADVASAGARRRASAAVAGTERDPDHVQRSEHAAGHGPAQEVRGQVREGRTA